MPRLIQTFAVAFAVVIILPSLTAKADIISFRQGVGGYTGAQDTYLERHNPGADQSANPIMTLQGAPGSNFEGNGMVLFSNIWGNEAGQIPRARIINSATLTVSTWSTNGNTIAGHKMLINWDDSATWNSPIFDSTGNGVGDGVQTNGTEAASAADFTYNANSAFESHVVDVTATVQEWSFDTDTTFGWVLYNQTGGTYRMASSEQSVAFRPMLTIDYSAVPEPSSVAFLIGLGALGLTGGYIRRRTKKANKN